MNAFIYEHRARCGVEPICSALQVAPSAYRRHAARKRDPALLPARARCDASLLPQVQRVYEQNLRVYGADKVWRQLIGRVGLVAFDVGAHVARRQERDSDAQAAEPARPVVGRAAGFHHHARDRAAGEPAFELRAGETMSFPHAPGGFGHAQLEDVLGQVHADDRAGFGLNGYGKARSIHVGLPSRHAPTPAPRVAGWYFDAEMRGGVHPIIQADLPSASCLGPTLPSQFTRMPMTAAAKPMLSHFGLYVRDLEAMVRFYTVLFGLRVTDRGESPVFKNTLVFLSADSNSHHQLVLASGRPPDATFSTVMQLSFKVQAIQQLREVRKAAMELGASKMREVNRGNSFSIYFSDPEDNTVETYFDSPYYVSQPHAGALDLEIPDRELLRQTEERCRIDPTFMLAEEWRRKFVASCGDG